MTDRLGGSRERLGLEALVARSITRERGEAMKLVARIEVDVHPMWVSHENDPTLEPDIQEIVMAKLEKDRNPNLFEGVRFKFIGFEKEGSDDGAEAVT